MAGMASGGSINSPLDPGQEPCDFPSRGSKRTHKRKIWESDPTSDEDADEDASPRPKVLTMEKGFDSVSFQEEPRPNSVVIIDHSSSGVSESAQKEMDGREPGHVPFEDVEIRAVEIYYEYNVSKIKQQECPYRDVIPEVGDMSDVEDEGYSEPALPSWLEVNLKKRKSQDDIPEGPICNNSKQIKLADTLGSAIGRHSWNPLTPPPEYYIGRTYLDEDGFHGDWHSSRLLVAEPPATSWVLGNEDVADWMTSSSLEFEGAFARMNIEMSPVLAKAKGHSLPR